MDAPRGSELSLALGLGIGLVAGVLYASGASRASAVLITPLGIGLLGVGSWTFRGHRRAPWWAWLGLATVTVALVALGVWALVYDAMHPPMAA